MWTPRGGKWHCWLVMDLEGKRSETKSSKKKHVGGHMGVSPTKCVSLYLLSTPTSKHSQLRRLWTTGWTEWLFQWRSASYWLQSPVCLYNKPINGVAMEAETKAMHESNRPGTPCQGDLANAATECPTCQQQRQLSVWHHPSKRPTSNLGLGDYTGALLPGGEVTCPSWADMPSKYSFSCQHHNLRTYPVSNLLTYNTT